MARCGAGPAAASPRPRFSAPQRWLATAVRMLVLLQLPARGHVAGELVSVWRGNTGWGLVATCGDVPNPSTCPPGTACGAQTWKPNVCGTAASPTNSSCAGCNYSGGSAVQCTVKCPPGTQLSLACSNPWLAPPNTRPCGSSGGACVHATNNTCADKPMRCVTPPRHPA